jgi:FkbM family methyltransferase
MKFLFFLKKIKLFFRFDLFDIHYLKSYSQEGEDMILNRIFEGKKIGFYIDIGAHHPKRFSNTYFFYKRGWKGINIEPNPETVNIFSKYRKRDINLCCGISNKEGYFEYFKFNEPALNTFNKKLMQERLLNKTYKNIGSELIPTYRLDNILTRNLSVKQNIDFLSVDVEGFDFLVLKSNNWLKYRPKCVLVEKLNLTEKFLLSDPLIHYMKKNRYNFFAKTYNTLIFIDSEK